MKILPIVMFHVSMIILVAVVMAMITTVIHSDFIDILAFVFVAGIVIKSVVSLVLYIKKALSDENN